MIELNLRGWHYNLSSSHCHTSDEMSILPKLGPYLENRGTVVPVKRSIAVFEHT